MRGRPVTFSSRDSGSQEICERCDGLVPAAVQTRRGNRSQAAVRGIADQRPGESRSDRYSRRV